MFYRIVLLAIDDFIYHILNAIFSEHPIDFVVPPLFGGHPISRLPVAGSTEVYIIIYYVLGIA